MTGVLRACPCCGLIQSLPEVPPRHVARCARCRTRIGAGRTRSGANSRAAAAALAALILYPLAISLPILRLERLGLSSEASVWSGSVGLLARGELLVGGVVFVCSVLVPLVKLVVLLALSLAPERLGRSHRARTFRIVELAGRWGMLDVLLVSVVVAWLKMGDLVEVTPGPAAIAFTACVLASLLASAWFDPHGLWEERVTARVPRKMERVTARVP